MISNTATFVRYSVVGDIQDNFWANATERIDQFKFKDIDDGYEEMSVGWVPIIDMLDTDFAYSSPIVGDYIFLSMRIDQRKVSPKALKKFCAKEERRVKLERQIPRLSRAQRLEIKQNMQLMLMKKAVPVPETYDLIWDINRHELVFFYTSNAPQEILESLFSKTFDMTIELKVPYTIAKSFLPPEDCEKLAQIAPSVIV